MKKFLIFSMAVMLVTVGRAAVGDTFEYNGLTYEITSESDHTVGVARNSNATGEVVIPSFAIYKNSRYVVTSIINNAFLGCSGLTAMNIPGTVTSIGSNAFKGAGLTSVTIPGSVTSIGDRAFYNCRFLTSVTIPGSVTSIGVSAFGLCEFMTEIIVEDSNKYYSSEDGVLYDYRKSILMQCPGAKTRCEIPNSVTSIEGNAFEGCGSLTSVVIPNSVTSIGMWAFNGCRSLTSVVIPNSVTSIGDHAFRLCENLTSAVIPAGINVIARFLFERCTSLTKITDLNPKPQIVETYGFSYVPASAVIYIPKGSLVPYMTADGWTQFTDFREMGALNISLSATTIELTEGDSAEITATVEKESGVTMESEEWSSSNPAVVTVVNGMVTAVGVGTAMISYTVTDGYGLSHTESCTVTVTDDAGIGEITVDASAAVDVYTIQGVVILRDASVEELNQLQSGLYILRQGNVTKKMVVK